MMAVGSSAERIVMLISCIALEQVVYVHDVLVLGKSVVSIVCNVGQDAGLFSFSSIKLKLRV